QTLERRAIRVQVPGIAPSPSPAPANVLPMADRHLPLNESMERVDESIEVDSVGTAPIELTPRRASREAEHHELGTADGLGASSQKLKTQLRGLGRVNTTQTERSEQDATSPIVRINIGRIEVRACQPPVARAPQPRREPARPSVTLTNYLTKKRGAGT